MFLPRMINLLYIKVEKMNSKSKYIFLIDTLNLIILPKCKTDYSFIEIISYQLEELEGDYYTFLHNNNIDELVNKGYLSSSNKILIEQIRTKISKIDSSLWNPEDFIWNRKWIEIRKDVLKVFLEITSYRSIVSCNKN